MNVRNNLLSKLSVFKEMEEAKGKKSVLTTNEINEIMAEGKWLGTLFMLFAL
jgi:hypothetical protein